MKILETNLAGFITSVLLDIKKGCFDAYKNGDIVLRLPDTVQFTCEVVRGSFNSITRDEITSPATTQTDTSQQGGQDTNVSNTTYTEFVYTTA